MSTSPRLSAPLVTALVAVLGGVLAPHLVRLPLWLGAGVLGVGMWRVWAARRGSALPGRPARVGLTVVVAGGVGAAFGTLTGLQAGVALLTAMAALKLLELRRRRDALVLLYLGYFLVAAQFLASQAPWTVAYLLAAVWGLTSLLVAVSREAWGEHPWAHAGLAARLALQGLPVMLVLFLFFPRLGSPLWGLPDQGRAVTGLDDRLAPGAISRLSRSDAVAFRATFDGAPPPAGERYWRGPVLAAYDGGTWRPGPGREVSPPRIESRGRPAEYRVLLEPHHREWLFALDLPGGAPGGARVSGRFELLTGEPVHRVRRYRVRSFTEHRIGRGLSEQRRARFLELPPDAHPQARALAREWRRATADSAAVVARGLRYFREGGFAYTLTPPELDGNWVDAFLFGSRRGFCGHYAGAFTFLMRAAGVPARVVTGYLGGTRNPSGDYLIVRQADAHAWTEVWLPDRGWVRVDPTTAVSPARAEEGLDGSVPEDDPVPLMARADGGWLRGVRLRLDALETAWDRWVLGYDAEAQRAVLGRVGLGQWPRMVGALAAGLVLSGGLVALLVLWRGRVRSGPVEAAFGRLERKLARAGLPRHRAEGPRAYAERVAGSRPDLAREVRDLARLYIRLRYEERGGPNDVRSLRRRVAGFSPRRVRAQA
ncbi:transglutaminase TgpA family protein [Thiohalorhabdus sp. Cl-TMA]|uniref:DUF3488 and DUF4129 domain-containing transglutaminase family protein n=1 Tax=Thiohalorhabdus methylotrophus TaxID=3242694 RepID=A0ABV4TSJ1_9GAMM